MRSIKNQKYPVMFAVTAAWFVFMTYLSHQNGEETAKASGLLMRLFWFLDEDQVEMVSGWTRKGAHVFCFTVRTVLLLIALRLANLHVWLGVAAVCVWCFFDEWTKRTIPGRHYSTFDVTLNVAGVLLGWLIWKGIHCIYLRFKCAE